VQQDSTNRPSAAPEGAGPSQDGRQTPGPITLEVNGKPYQLELETRVTLLDALRE
jgi:xanthine dehydrogenase YagT iron-sulfur-binding subunit